MGCAVQGEAVQDDRRVVGVDRGHRAVGGAGGGDEHLHGVGAVDELAEDATVDAPLAAAGAELVEVDEPFALGVGRSCVQLDDVGRRAGAVPALGEAELEDVTLEGAGAFVGPAGVQLGGQERRLAGEHAAADQLPGAASGEHLGLAGHPLAEHAGLDEPVEGRRGDALAAQAQQRAGRHPAASLAAEHGDEPVAAGKVDAQERMLGVEALAASAVVAAGPLGEGDDVVVALEQDALVGLGAVAPPGEGVAVRVDDQLFEVVVCEVGLQRRRAPTPSRAPGS